MVEYRVKDIRLAKEGSLKVQWAESRMPVLMALRRRHQESKPLRGMRISGCLHVTKETAVLVETLIAAGAEVSWCGCNPLSTQDDVAAALANKGIPIFAWHGMSKDEFYWSIEKTLEIEPTLTLDDGADLIMTVHQRKPELAKSILGGTEETTTGVHRLRAMALDGALKYPILAINDTETKWDFDNVYGTGQSSLDGILRTTSILLAGKNFVTVGYGHCGRGCAMRAKGMGALSIVTEVRPTAAIKALLEGHRVMSMEEAAPIGDIFVTATGMKDVIVGRHFEKMKNGAVVCNTGHYDCEIKIPDLEALASSHRQVRSNCDEYILKNGHRIYLLARGRLINLVGAEGHPSEVMDMSFANQFLGLMRLAKEGKDLSPRVYDVEPAQDEEVARLKLETMGVGIDTLTEEQKAYLTDYEAGT